MGLPVLLGVTHTYNTCTYTLTSSHSHVHTHAGGGLPGAGSVGDRPVQLSGGLEKLRLPRGRWPSWSPRGGIVSSLV